MFNRLKTKYAITHIVNCSAKPNLYPDHFQYEQLNMAESEVQIPITIQHIFQFARDAIKAKGRVRGPLPPLSTHLLTSCGTL